MAKLLNETKVKLIPKEFERQLSFGLSHSEFKCKCSDIDCTFTVFHGKTEKAYAAARKQWARPIRINRGYSCQRHNQRIGGSPTSSHLQGLALDIDHSTIQSTKEKNDFYLILCCHFDVVIRYDTFFHCHNQA